MKNSVFFPKTSLFVYDSKKKKLYIYNIYNWMSLEIIEMLSLNGFVVLGCFINLA